MSRAFSVFYCFFPDDSIVLPVRDVLFPVQVAIRDFPHARYLCVHFPFKNTLHSKFCAQVDSHIPLGLLCNYHFFAITYLWQSNSCLQWTFQTCILVSFHLYKDVGCLSPLHFLLCNV